MHLFPGRTETSCPVKRRWAVPLGVEDLGRAGPFLVEPDGSDLAVFSSFRDVEFLHGTLVYDTYVTIPEKVA